MSTTIRRIQTGEGATLREIRLRALTVAPDAFASSLSTEAAFPAERWNEMADRAASGNQVATFLAFDGGVLVGLVTSFRKDTRSETADLVSMWVAKEARRRGVAKMLVDGVLNWAKECELGCVELWVLPENEAAERFYRKAGFSADAQLATLPYGSGSGRRMWRALD